jgi:hypothetical protein
VGNRPVPVGRPVEGPWVVQIKASRAGGSDRRLCRLVWGQIFDVRTPSTRSLKTSRAHIPARDWYELFVEESLSTTSIRIRTNRATDTEGPPGGSARRRFLKRARFAKARIGERMSMGLKENRLRDGWPCDPLHVGQPM